MSSNKTCANHWLFVDENGHIYGFNSFKEAHDYAFKIYDEDLRFDGKNGKTYCYKNSWNDEDVYISKLEMYKK